MTAVCTIIQTAHIAACVNAYITGRQSLEQLGLELDGIGATGFCINEIKAGAIEEAADKCAHMTLDGRICYQAGLHEYAKQLREGE